MNHQHEWAYTDQGVHWCSLDYEPDCTATRVHDSPCDHPEEHQFVEGSCTDCAEHTEGAP